MKPDPDDNSENSSSTLNNYHATSPIASWIFGGLILVFLMAVVFIRIEPDKFPIIRFLMALSAGFFALFFVGGVLLKGTLNGLRWSATGGFALFLAIQFFVDPFKVLPNASEQPGATPTPTVTTTTSTTTQTPSTNSSTKTPTPTPTPVPTISAPPSSPTGLTDNSVVGDDQRTALRKQNKVRELQGVENEKGLSQLPNGIYGFITPWTNLTDANLQNTRVEYRPLGTATLEIHKLQSGVVLVVGFVSQEDANKLSNDRVKVQIVLFPKLSEGETNLVQIPRSRITYSNERDCGTGKCIDITIAPNQ